MVLAISVLLAMAGPARAEGCWVDLPQVQRLVTVRGQPARILVTPSMLLTGAAGPQGSLGVDFRLHCDLTELHAVLPRALNGWIRRDPCGRSLEVSDLQSVFNDDRVLARCRLRVVEAKRAKLGVFGRELFDAGCTEVLDQTFDVEVEARPVVVDAHTVQIVLRTRKAVPTGSSWLGGVRRSVYEMLGFTKAEVDAELRRKITDDPDATVRLPDSLREMQASFTAARQVSRDVVELEGRLTVTAATLQQLFDKAREAASKNP